MKKQIIVTLILLIATAFLTITYFKDIRPPGSRTSEVMQSIPDDAMLIFQYNNDKSFYEIFKGNKLFKAITGEQNIRLLGTLNQEVLHNALLERYFDGQNIFISVHPSSVALTELLFTVNASKEFNPELLNQLSKAKNTGLLITPLSIKDYKGFTLYTNGLKQRFYLIFKKNGIICGSFSRSLIEEAAGFKAKKEQVLFTLPSEQQRNNSLANLYVNYNSINSLFASNNTDFLKSLRLLPGTVTLTLNYRSDALMFNGITTILPNKPASYITLFSHQQPVDNHLKDIFPSTTAYSVNFGISDQAKFKTDLSQWQQTAGINGEKENLFKQIKTETGIDLMKDFNRLLANEFAVVTTRYFEKLAIISVKDGSKLKMLLSTISKTTDENSGTLSYDKLPFFLLGDVFSYFKHPCYTVIDNYLILANSSNELSSYRDTYLNQKFLSKNKQYNQFDNLLTERSNVAFFINFKNAEPVFKQDLPLIDPKIFNLKDDSWANFYGASWQLTAADDNFYTNFCMRLSPDSIILKTNK